MSVVIKNTPEKMIAIFGSAGSAFETADIAFAAGFDRVVLLAENPEEQEKNTGKGLTILMEQEVNNLAEQGYVFALGIADSHIRERLVKRYQGSGLVFPNLVHPSVIFGYGQEALLEKSRGTVIAAGTVLSNHISFGDFSLVNRSVTIGHDCEVGEYVSLMPGAIVSGNAVLEEHSFVGAGATILQGSDAKKMRIGQGAVVGAASLVNREVEAGQTVAGIPARPLSKDMAV